MKNSTPDRTLPGWRPSSTLARVLAAVGVAGFVVTAWGPSVASAVPVQGRLGLPASLGDAQAVPEQYWELRNGLVPTRPDHLEPARELTIVLRGDTAAEDPGCDYGLRGGDFMPRTMVVETGATLRITNHDATEHELYVEAIDRFTALSTAPGMARSEHIPAGGPYEIADALYPHIDGRIVSVTGLVACGVMGDHGAYSFQNVAPGTYQLEVYRAGAVVAHREVQIAEGGAVTLPELSLAAAPAAPEGE